MTRAESEARRLLERLAYKYKHRDFKGTTRDGAKAVLRLGTGGTELCQLSQVPEDELRGVLPKLVLAALDAPATPTERRQQLAFADWKVRAARYAVDLVGIHDIWADDDPYDLAEVAVAEFAAGHKPRAFIEAAFAEDLTRQQYDRHLSEESFQASLEEEQ